MTSETPNLEADAEEPAFDVSVILAAKAIAQSRGWVDHRPAYDMSLAETVLAAVDELDEFVDEMPFGIKRHLMRAGIAAIAEFAEVTKDFHSKAK